MPWLTVVNAIVAPMVVSIAMFLRTVTAVTEMIITGQLFIPIMLVILENHPVSPFSGIAPDVIRQPAGLRPSSNPKSSTRDRNYALRPTTI